MHSLKRKIVLKSSTASDKEAMMDIEDAVNKETNDILKGGNGNAQSNNKSKGGEKQQQSGSRGGGDGKDHRRVRKLYTHL